MEKKILRPIDLAEYLSISRSYAYALIAAGHFVPLKIGKKCIGVTKASVDLYLDRQQKLFDAVESVDR